MNKIIVLLAVLALTGCAETANEGAYLIGGGGHVSSGGADVASQQTRAVAYEAPRDVAPRQSPAVQPTARGEG